MRSSPFFDVLLAAALLGAQRPAITPGQRSYVSVDAPVVALTNVRLIDGTGAEPREAQTIVLEQGRILRVGPAASTAIPATAQRIDLNGHTVIPGIVGLHEHTYFYQATRATQMSVSGPMAYLAMGVTTIRTAGSMFPYQELNMQRAVQRGDLPGPRMYISGPYLNGAAGGSSMSAGLPSPDAARRLVAYWASEGATWLKLQGNLTRETAGAIIDEAHKHGVRVTGHLCSITFAEAATLGIDALEHGFITNSAYVPGKEADRCPEANMRVQADVDVNSAEVQASIRELAGKVALTSTLAVYETFMPDRARLDPRAMDLLAPDTRREVEETHRTLTQGGLVVPPRLLKKMMQWERDFVRAGGLLGAGVDPWGTGMLPGFGNMRNYELLVEAGFTPVEAVRIMTLNGAKILHDDAVRGTIEPGKAADLVVIRGDIAATPSSVYDVVTVFRDGVGYDSRKMLDAIKGLVGVR